MSILEFPGPRTKPKPRIYRNNVTIGLHGLGLTTDRENLDPSIEFLRMVRAMRDRFQKENPTSYGK